MARASQGVKGRAPGGKGARGASGSTRGGGTLAESGTPTAGSARERLLAAALDVLSQEGPAGFNVRRIAEAAGCSTIGVYSHFGCKAGLLDELFRVGAVRLREALERMTGTGQQGDGEQAGGEQAGGEQAGGEQAGGEQAGGEQARGEPVERLIELLGAYRRAALADPALYALLFERTVPGFVPHELSRREMEACFRLLVAAVGRCVEREAETAATLLWGTAHGLVSLELTRRAWGEAPGGRRADVLFETAVRAAVTGMLSAAAGVAGAAAATATRRESRRRG